MPTIKNPQLTLTRVGANVTINVRYNAVFSTFERNLAQLGLRFRERIAVIGVDPPGATTGTVLPIPFSSRQFITVTDDPNGTPRDRSVTVTRAELDEDGNPVVNPDFDADEIRCRIRIEAIGLPPAVTEAFTDQEVLGGIFQPSTAAEARSSD
jgi:hypothetical protein